MPTYKLSLAMRLHDQYLIEDIKASVFGKHANKSALIARGADMQLRYSCVLAPLATNEDLWNPVMLCLYELDLFDQFNLGKNTAHRLYVVQITM